MNYFYWFCRYFCQWFCVLMFRVRVYGLKHVPAEGGVLLVSNHLSYGDPIFATMAIPRECNYMARDSLFKNRWFGWLITAVNAFPVKRGAADISAIKESLRRLKQGRVLLLFPEGTRSPDGRIGPMLPGVGAIAVKARVPIVPTLLDGVVQAWPRHRALPRPGRVIVEYGRPLTPADYAGLTAEELMTELRRRLVVMQHRWHRLHPQRRLQWFDEAGDPDTTGTAEQGAHTRGAERGHGSVSASTAVAIGD